MRLAPADLVPTPRRPPQLATAFIGGRTDAANASARGIAYNTPSSELVQECICDDDFNRSAEVHRAVWRPGSFRVALGSQPVDAAGALQPFVDLGFALESLDISWFGARIFREDLPIVLGDPLHFEGDSGFAHGIDYAPSGPGRKPKSRPPYLKKPTARKGPGPLSISTCRFFGFEGGPLEFCGWNRATESRLLSCVLPN
jgi:hypothetical protein